MSKESSSRVPEHLLSLAQRFFDAGWSHADVVHALNNPPDGVTRALGDPMRWEVARARLVLWMDESLQPVLSASQRRARANSAKTRAQTQAREKRAEAERRRTGDLAAAVARARQVLAEASPAAAKVMASRATKVVTRADPERWARADEAAATAVVTGAVSEVWAPEPEEDPAEVAQRVSRALALRRARRERAGRAGSA
ncbi:hypothetical protein ACQPYK_25045 [Streptosporangium sp. CA-135522]|uniref:hypothetical protein n=1 Tax=Streptosporangium sp. CA-135522 TaxID=3240072 RepID=UPI003D911AD3